MAEANLFRLSTAMMMMTMWSITLNYSSQLAF